MRWLDECLLLPRNDREQPINVAHLKLLVTISENENIKTDELLPFFDNEKPTLVSRLNLLVEKGLVDKLPKFNRGGSTHPNYFKTTTKGKKIAKAILQRA